MSSRPYQCAIKWASEDYLGIPLQSGCQTLQHQKYSGSVAETFLLVETSTGCQQVYPILHCLCYFQTGHQETRLVHSSAYSWQALRIHLSGLHVGPPFHQEGKWLCFCGCWSLFQDGDFGRLQEEHHGGGHCQNFLWMSVGTLWDPPNHYLRLG